MAIVPCEFPPRVPGRGRASNNNRRGRACPVPLLSKADTSGAGDHKGRPYGFFSRIFNGLRIFSVEVSTPGAGSRTCKEQRIVGDGLVPSRVRRQGHFLPLERQHRVVREPDPTARPRRRGLASRSNHSSSTWSRADAGHWESAGQDHRSSVVRCRLCDSLSPPGIGLGLCFLSAYRFPGGPGAFESALFRRDQLPAQEQEQNAGYRKER